MFKSGDRLRHICSGKKCTFKEYEVEGWTDPNTDYCAWVIFDRIWFKRKVEKLIFLKNLELL
jgi:hypothetical protein